MLLNDHEIRALCVSGARNTPVENPLLSPFSLGVQGDNVISYGLSHAGYDLRLGPKVLIFKNSFNQTIDPKRFKVDKAYNERVFDSLEGIPDGEQVIIPPHSYILGYSLEYIRVRRWLKGRCVGKSTYARCGIMVNTTPLEPGWEGHLTLEIANVTPCPVAVYVGEGIAQLEFEELSAPCKVDYADKDGKYNRQEASPVPARVKE